MKTQGIPSKVLACVASFVLVAALAGCSATDYSGQTLTGEVTAINGSSVTVNLGELAAAEPANSADNNATGGADNAAGEGAEAGDNSAGDATATPPDKPEGESTDSSATPPALPEGESGSAAGGDAGTAGGDAGAGAASGDTASGGSTPPALPEGESAGSGSAGGAPSDAGAAPSDAGAAPSGDNASEPPAKPEGESGSSSEEPPALPEGESADGTAPDADGGTSGDGTAPEGTAPDAGAAPDNMGAQFEANGQTATFDLTNATFDGLTLDEIEEGTILTIVVGENNTVTSVSLAQAASGAPSSSGPGGGGSSTVNQGTAANTISDDATIEGATYTSTGDDENALRVTNGATVTLDGITVDKSAGSSSNTESGDFYGMNAALLATDGAQITIKGATVTSSAQNGNGIFSYGEGTQVTVSDTTIKTTADNSGGIQTTGGGTTNATNLTVETNGSSSAAIRSDRGGGTVNVDGGTYTSNGYNSPAIYSTAAITAKNATLTANNSEALVIEGKNSITLENCAVSGNMSSTKGTSSDENVHTVMIYQSMSGDADVGTSQFSMTGGTLTSNNGDVFYVTNTHCTMKLSGVEIASLRDGAAASDGVLLRVVGNSASRGWGSAGANGGQLELTLDNQQLNGDIVVDTISTLDLVFSNGSELTGTINIVENEQGGTAVANNAVVKIEAGCTWNLTGDCTLTSLDNAGTINFNGHTITLADGTVLR